MQMTNRVPDWVTPVAWTFLALSLVSAAYIALDVLVRRHRRTSVAAELVWITSALYLGPFAVAMYRRDRDTAQPAPADALPGGGASAVAHLIGVPLVIASGLTIAGIDLWPMIIVIGAIAMVLLFVHERARHARPAPATGQDGPSERRRPSLATAAAVAVVTVLAFDIGMGGWMLLLHFNELMPPATTGSFWFLMQVGVLAGLATGWPAVRWLRRREPAA